MGTAFQDAGGGEQTADRGWARYRCPICGHRDRLDGGAAAARTLRCTHCTAELEVRGAVDGGESVEVGVRTDPNPH